MAVDNKPDLRVRIGGLELQNPVMTASGTFGYGEEFGDLVNLHCLGGIVAKGISLKPRPGNPPPRVVETSCGMLNAIGLENVGVARFINEKMAFLRQTGTAVVVNILGDTVDDYSELATRLNGVEGLAAIEVNISCPNVRKGGVAFGSQPKMARAVTAAVRKQTSLPVIVKLSPNVTDITEIARAVEDSGADAVSLINTLLGMAIDSKARRPRLANIVGGLSGPAIKPVALRMVWQVANAVRIPVIGIGGITTAEDAVEFLLAGATAVQVGTANFVNPRAAEEIVTGLADYLQEQKMESVLDLIGSLQTA
jgi:dihydroorotate dehydrogenase (NAD+) catalytic subunit